MQSWGLAKELLKVIPGAYMYLVNRVGSAVSYLFEGEPLSAVQLSSSRS